MFFRKLAIALSICGIVAIGIIIVVNSIFKILLGNNPASAKTLKKVDDGLTAVAASVAIFLGVGIISEITYLIVRRVSPKERYPYLQRKVEIALDDYNSATESLNKFLIEHPEFKESADANTK